jgi:hypothetical protein
MAAMAAAAPQVGRFEVAGFASPGKVLSKNLNFTVPVGTLWEEKAPRWKREAVKRGGPQKLVNDLCRLHIRLYKYILNINIYYIKYIYMLKCYLKIYIYISGMME